MHGFGVPKRVWTDARTAESWHHLGRPVQVLLQEIAGTLACQPLPAPILDERLVVFARSAFRLQKPGHQTRCLRQQRTEPLLPPLPKDTHEGRAQEMEVGWFQIQQFLDAGAGVVE